MNQPMPHVTVTGLSDVGRVRDHNEDYIAWDEMRGLVLLADGMGGHNAGEVASELAVRRIREAMQDILTAEMIASNVINYSEALCDAIIYANDEINHVARESEQYSGMGTTIVAMLFVGERAILANVGDSRIYRYRDDTLEQLTVDHSLVQEMVDSGMLNEQEAQASISRNVITRALGISEQVEVDIVEESPRDGDTYLLCSDGLTDLVADERIRAALISSRGDMDMACAELVAQANEEGGRDNISIVLARYGT